MIRVVEMRGLPSSSRAREAETSPAKPVAPARPARPAAAATLLFAGLLVFGVSATLLHQEARLQGALARDASLERFAAEAPRLAAAVGERPVALRTRIDLSTACLRALLARDLPLIAPDLRESLVSGCAALADRLLARAPGLAEAWLVRAAAAGDRGDMSVFAEALRRSSETLRRDLWMAEARLRLAAVIAMRRPDATPPDEVLGRDLDGLVAHWRGRPVAAELHRAHPGLRPAIVAALRRADPVDAERTLRLISGETPSRWSRSFPASERDCRSCSSSRPRSRSCRAATGPRPGS